MKSLFSLSVFGISFALVEAATVVYLRHLYYPNGFTFPLKPPPLGIFNLELWREAATLAMLGSVGLAVGRTRWGKFALFIFSFGIWDIFYYFWLKVFTDWPGSFFTPDLLFLIPVPWWGPVAAPVIVAGSLVVAAVVILVREEKGKPFLPGWPELALVTAGAGMILYTFMADAGRLNAGLMPSGFRWGVFFAGEVAGIYAFACALEEKSA